MLLSSCGTITFGGKVDSTNVCSNENIRVTYGINNESTSRIKAVVVELRCYVTHRAHHTHAASSHRVFSKRVEVETLTDSGKGR
jgi:hypothetical protein